MACGCNKSRPVTQPFTAPAHQQKPATAPKPPPATQPATGTGRLPSRTASASLSFRVTYVDGSSVECGSRLEAQAALTRAGGRGRIDPL